MAKREKPVEYILNRIMVDNAGCWIWQGKRLSTASGKRLKDYGLASHHSKWVLAHRLSYQAFVAPIPKGRCVLHSCDVARCVNPKHLWVGTNKDNTQDMIKKGRGGWVRGALGRYVKAVVNG